MSQSAYHWEARRKQRIIDRRQVALARLQEAQAQEEARLAELAAKEERERREQEEARRKELEQHLRTRNKGDMKKSVHNRERIKAQRLMQEHTWRDERVGKMNKAKKNEVLQDVLRDHRAKEKLLRDHGVFNGPHTYAKSPKMAQY
ncbi:uncharacterized protein [Ptychodera flava]|uniref:uncharacterized protein isoform X1 n=1 Tax=Ptychodera flava TaxID=63121 RepID=UPI003969C2DF